MGSTYRRQTKEEIEEHKRWQTERDAKRLAEIERFAMKCTAIAVDNIITNIVRPGPQGKKPVNKQPDKNREPTWECPKCYYTNENDRTWCAVCDYRRPA